MAKNNVEQFVRQYAAQIGIDPDIAAKVVKGEGGFSDPYQRGMGPAPKSQAPGFGSTENSFGPLQLYVSGTGAGLGDRALAAGIDPRKDWQGGVRFGLDEAKRAGWSQWYGAKANGITGMMGINGTPAQANSRPGLTLSSGPLQPGSAAPPLPPPVNITDHPIASDVAPTPGAIAPQGDLMAMITKLTTPGTEGKASPLGAIANAFSPQTERRVEPIIQTGALQSSDSLQQTQMASAQQLMQSLMAKRKAKVPGFGIGGMMG